MNHALTKGARLYHQRRGQAMPDDAEVQAEADRLRGNAVARGAAMYRAAHGTGQAAVLARAALDQAATEPDLPA